MSAQLALDLAARSRATDGAASHKAAEKHDRSGKTKAHAALVLEALREANGSTYREITAALAAKGTKLEAVEVMRRCDSLRKAGKVVSGLERRCRVTGNEMCTWWLTERAK